MSSIRETAWVPCPHHGRESVNEDPKKEGRMVCGMCALVLEREYPHNLESNVEACPIHGSETLKEDHETGDVICTQCGIVVGILMMP